MHIEADAERFPPQEPPLAEDALRGTPAVSVASGVPPRLSRSSVRVAPKRRAGPRPRVSALAAALESVGDAAFVVDRRWRVVRLNAAAARLFGRPRRGLVGAVLWDAVPDVGGTLVERVVREAAGSGRAVETEEFVPSFGGWLAVRAAPHAGGVAVAIAETGERRRAQRSLEESEARFRATFEQAAVGIAHVGLDGRWLRVNDRLCAIVGYAREELLGRTFQEITYPEDLEADLANVQALLAGEIPTYAAEKRYIRKDGSLVWINLTVALLREASGAPRYFISVVEDISDRKAAERALRESEDRLRLALEAARMSTWEWDHATDRRVASTSLGEVFGGAPETFSGLLEMVHPEDRERLRESARRAVAEGADYDPEFRVRRPDGEERWLASRGRLFGGDGQSDRLVGVTLDITQRKRIEQALAESEARFRMLAETMPQLVFTIDPAGRCDYVNARWLAYTGLSPAESHGPGWTRVLHPVDAADFLAAWDETRRDGRDFVRECRIRAADGADRWFLVQVAPMRDAAGAIRSWIGTGTDIDDRRRAGEALAFSEGRLRALVAATAQVIWTTNAAGESDEDLVLGGITDNLWADFTGQTLAEIAGQGWQTAVHPEDRERVAREWAAGIAAGEPFLLEYRLRRHDGGWRTLVDRAVPVRDGSGAITSWIGTGTDVTDARAAEEAVRASEARFRRLFDANIFGVFTWTYAGRITSANDAFLGMIAATRDDLASGRVNWRALTPPEWVDADQRAIAELRSSGACAPFEKDYRRLDGSRVPVLVAAAEFPGSHDEGIALVIDLTERKAQERFEQEFLAEIAHDLKNPLAAMRAQAQLMRRRLDAGRLGDEVAGDGLAAIETNATRVAKRIEELSDTALLRAGQRLDLVREPLDLVALVEARAASYRQTTDRHRIVVEAAAPALVGAWDANRLERVIDNLFANAVKYSPAGGEVRVDLRREEAGDGAWATLAIGDEGVGIPAADLPHVFERYRRGSNVQGRVRGTGIGLAGVRQLVEQHGGTIHVESAEGRGSTFTIRLPLDEVLSLR